MHVERLSEEQGRPLVRTEEKVVQYIMLQRCIIMCVCFAAYSWT